jgi:hypothetical protein
MALLKQRMDGELFEKGQRRMVSPELIIRPSAFLNAAAKAPVVQPIGISGSV